MKRFAAILVVLVSAAALALPALAADGPVKTYSQDVTLGFYRGQVVSYLDFGPVKLRAGNKVAPIWAFTNGDDGQRNIIDTVPGRKDYTPLWAVHLVTWKAARRRASCARRRGARRTAFGRRDRQGDAHRRQLSRPLGHSERALGRLPPRLRSADAGDEAARSSAPLRLPSGISLV